MMEIEMLVHLANVACLVQDLAALCSHKIELHTKTYPAVSQIC